MSSSARFRQLFTHRIASAIGASALVLPTIHACSGKAVIDGSGTGAGGASSSSDASSSSNTSNASSNVSSSQSGVGGATTTSGAGGCTESSTTGSGGPQPFYHYSMCLDGLNTPCPADTVSAEDIVRQVLDGECCVDFDSCEDLRSVDCGPFVTASGQCCFEITTEELFCAVPGRPYSHAGEVRLAELGDGGGWLAPIDTIDAASLSASERTRLADKWANDGLAEHASVASFARFALQLMAVGAPSDLVALAQRAALDEVEHARLAFAVASAYAGRQVGPGPFPVAEGGMAVTLAELAAATAAEGCINETLSTLRAHAELANTTDPAVRAVLTRIVADETRHAELAWRTVAWAIRTGGADVRRAVEAVFSRATEAPDPDVRDVIAPLARELLSDARSEARV